MIILLYGQPASGKTTLANRLCEDVILPFCFHIKIDLYKDMKLNILIYINVSLLYLYTLKHYNSQNST